VFCLIFYTLCIDSNDPFAIGFCHYYGIGTLEDNNKAFKYFEISAKEGNEYGQWYLGECFYYGYGHGTEPDHKKAFYWFFKSAKQGFYIAQSNISFMYRYGKGCDRNEFEGNIWHKNSCKLKFLFIKRCSLFLKFMEQKEKKLQVFKTKTEARKLLKECFYINNPFILLSFIPFEIWKHIMNVVAVVDLKSIVFLSQTCRGFNLLFENLQENDVSIATRFRKEGQIILGK